MPVPPVKHGVGKGRAADACHARGQRFSAWAVHPSVLQVSYFSLPIRRAAWLRIPDSGAVPTPKSAPGAKPDN